MKKNVYFVSGIDTNIGKSYATAFLAKTWNERGIRTITEKLIQMWNPLQETEYFTKEKPWLLNFFDQIRFYPVSAS